MACQNGTCSTPNSCNCAGTSYTIPANAVYGDSTCRTPTEPCSEVSCAECVRNCHAEDKWCVQMPYTIDAVTTVVDFCIHQGERLDQMLQKLSLAQGDIQSYPYKVKNFYLNSKSGTSNEDFSLNFLYYEFSDEVTQIQLFFAADSDDGVWQEITAFNTTMNPLTSNSFTLNQNSISVISGTTYKFKFVTSTADAVYDPGSSIVFVTIP
jgi:hypothetical protein